MNKSKVDVLLGLQWGDEGKGKVVDVLTPDYDAVARFQGGPNAGHTLEFEGKKYVLRSIPSGIFQDGQTNIIGNGVVLDPVLFREEAEALEASGTDLKKVLKISKKAHLILPTHRLLDAANEKAKGDAKIGTTGKGIGPTYTDKVSRNGLRVGDTLHDFEAKYAAAKARHLDRLRSMGAEPDQAQLDALEAKWLDAINYLKEYDLIDSEHVINKMLSEGKKVLCEGAQGTLLDVDFGSYPFVTSSNTVCAGACTGLGVAPRNIGKVYGIFKAYCTRVGSGPFPTELHDETGKRIRDLGHEYGAVTGRERRCGWIDLVALRYAIMINGVTNLIMMKSDVLDGFDEIKACVAYEIDGERVEEFPYSIESESLKPVYVTLPGWKTDMTAMKSEDEFPAAFSRYINFLEAELGTPISIVSIGPDREQTIRRDSDDDLYGDIPF
ncbi:MAG: adenylosuccinate synthase [Candidatus Amulumruptor caecigallinarius]|nr:adenylosuccinate synthase [Candidatus Amulumruptor caecigallinarius]MCM1396309.1 adenylosuccinate synthase [Candidatus Amulumruptor caecigallinarius]MCM1453749.1 adenylosuccinate synthase [bacterium]